MTYDMTYALCTMQEIYSTHGTKALWHDSYSNSVDDNPFPQWTLWNGLITFSGSGAQQPGVSSQYSVANSIHLLTFFALNGNLVEISFTYLLICQLLEHRKHLRGFCWWINDDFLLCAMCTVKRCTYLKNEFLIEHFMTRQYSLIYF